MADQQTAKKHVEVGRVVAGKFRIDRVIGEGGMGIVVEAMHLQLEERVALKFLKADAVELPDVMTRFDREARAAAKLKSEHVAKVLDVGIDGHIPYMVMEYLDGQDLAQVLAAKGPLDIVDAVEYVIQACEGLGEAHTRGIVHRDIKPENLFLTHRADGWTVVKLLDFGISKAALAGPSNAEMQVSTTIAIMGSPYYMSPEQLRSTKSVDHRADLWSLGVVLFELLTGTVPFDETKEFTELVADILESPNRQLTAFRHGAPYELEAVIDKCLAKDRNERFQNAAELAIALLPFAPKRSRVVAERTASMTRASALMSEPKLVVPPSNFPPSTTSSALDIANKETLPAPPMPAPARAPAEPPAPPPRPHRWMIVAGGLLAAAMLGLFLLPNTNKKEAPAAGTIATPAPSVVQPAYDLRLCGSNTIGAELAPALIEALLKKKGAAGVTRAPGDKPQRSIVSATLGGHPLGIVIESLGTSTGFQGLTQETCDVAMASRGVTDEEAGVLREKGFGDVRTPASEHVVALDGIAVIVHPNNPVHSLDRPLLHDLFTGKVNDWDHAGGSAGSVHVMSRDAQSGTYDTFKHLVLNSDGLAPTTQRFSDSDALSDAVAADPAAVGFIGLAYVRSAKVVAVGDPSAQPMLPTPFTVTTEGYMLSRRLLFYTTKTARPFAQELITFALSAEGQNAVRAAGFVDLTITIKDSGCTAKCPPRYAALVQGARRLSLDFRFRPGTSSLDSRATRDLDRVVQFMRAYPESHLMLFGFDHDSDDSTLNTQSSDKLAHTIDSEFRARGLNPSVVTGFGDQMPITALGSNEESRHRNRRVEVWLK